LAIVGGWLFTRLAAGAEPGRPLLVPAADAPIPAPSGGALVAANVNGDPCADLILVADKNLKIFFGGADRDWPQKADRSIELAAGASEIAVADLTRVGHQAVDLAHHDGDDGSVLLGCGARDVQAGV